MDIRVNGGAALEHPPLFSWMQAVMFSMFGFSDTLAKLPRPLCGFGTILLTGWLARRFTRDSLAAVLAMFVMATSIYFLKYAARAMTDVPFTFFFLCAVCAWVLAEADPRWYLAVGLFIAMAQMTRAMMGLSLPILFAIDAFARPRRVPRALRCFGLRAGVPAAHGLVCPMDLSLSRQRFTLFTRCFSTTKYMDRFLRHGGVTPAPLSIFG